MLILARIANKFWDTETEELLFFIRILAIVITERELFYSNLRVTKKRGFIKLMELLFLIVIKMGDFNRVNRSSFSCKNTPKVCQNYVYKMVFWFQNNNDNKSFMAQDCLAQNSFIVVSKRSNLAGSCQKRCTTTCVVI